MLRFPVSTLVVLEYSKSCKMNNGPDRSPELRSWEGTELADKTTMWPWHDWRRICIAQLLWRRICQDTGFWIARLGEKRDARGAESKYNNPVLSKGNKILGNCMFHKSLAENALAAITWQVFPDYQRHTDVGTWVTRTWRRRLELDLGCNYESVQFRWRKEVQIFSRFIDYYYSMLFTATSHLMSNSHSLTL
jgi:hypothetical protein